MTQKLINFCTLCNVIIQTEKNSENSIRELKNLSITGKSLVFLGTDRIDWEKGAKTKTHKNAH